MLVDFLFLIDSFHAVKDQLSFMLIQVYFYEISLENHYYHVCICLQKPMYSITKIHYIVIRRIYLIYMLD